MALNLHNVMVASVLAGRRLLPLHCLLRLQMVCRVTLDFLFLVVFFFFLPQTPLFLCCNAESTHSKLKSLLNSTVPTVYPPLGSPGSPLGPGGPCSPTAPPGSPCRERLARRILMNERRALKSQPQRENPCTGGKNFFCTAFINMGTLSMEKSFKICTLFTSHFLVTFIKEMDPFKQIPTGKKNVFFSKEAFIFAQPLVLKKHKTKKALSNSTFCAICEVSRERNLPNLQHYTLKQLKKHFRVFFLMLTKKTIFPPAVFS